jgi:hypothetical protein
MWQVIEGLGVFFLFLEGGNEVGKWKQARPVILKTNCARIRWWYLASLAVVGCNSEARPFILIYINSAY